jgi:hypothetical protein
VKESIPMASIIIDEIVPTTWRLRLRGADGKTREVEYKAGTPLRLDAAASPTEARRQGRSAAQGPAREAARRETEKSRPIPSGPTSRTTKARL